MMTDTLMPLVAETVRDASRRDHLGQLPPSGEEVACDRAADAVGDYFVRLGFAESSETVQLASVEIAQQASASLPKLRRSDASIVRATAIRLVVRDLDHWLRVLAADDSACDGLRSRSPRNVPACTAAMLETQRRRVVPEGRPARMQPQRFRSSSTLKLRAWVRRACGVVARFVPRWAT